MKKVFSTKLGQYLIAGIDQKSTMNFLLEKYRGKIQLILTSPPFPLNEKKEYGNLSGDAYKKWLSELAPLFSQLLTPSGSIVIEIGNAWEPKAPGSVSAPFGVSHAIREAPQGDASIVTGTDLLQPSAPALSGTMGLYTSSYTDCP